MTNSRGSDLVANDRYFLRPPSVDCLFCRGHGVHQRWSDKPTRICSNCCMSGLDAIPWSELFKSREREKPE